MKHRLASLWTRTWRPVANSAFSIKLFHYNSHVAISVMKHNFAYKISDIRNDEILFLTCSNTHREKETLFIYRVLQIVFFTAKCGELLVQLIAENDVNKDFLSGIINLMRLHEVYLPENVFALIFRLSVRTGKCINHMALIVNKFRIGCFWVKN